MANLEPRTSKTQADREALPSDATFTKKTRKRSRSLAEVESMDFDQVAEAYNSLIGQGKPTRFSFFPGRRGFRELLNVSGGSVHRLVEKYRKEQIEEGGLPFLFENLRKDTAEGKTLTNLVFFARLNSILIEPNPETLDHQLRAFYSIDVIEARRHFEQILPRIHEDGIPLDLALDKEATRTSIAPHIPEMLLACQLVEVARFSLSDSGVEAARRRARSALEHLNGDTGPREQVLHAHTSALAFAVEEGRLSEAQFAAVTKKGQPTSDCTEALFSRVCSSLHLCRLIDRPERHKKARSFAVIGTGSSYMLQWWGQKLGKKSEEICRSYRAALGPELDEIVRKGQVDPEVYLRGRVEKILAREKRLCTRTKWWSEQEDYSAESEAM